jgi:hypothetical protein
LKEQFTSDMCKETRDEIERFYEALEEKCEKCKGEKYGV